MRKAIVFGATGQVGSFMCEKLIYLGYTVFGVFRRSSSDASLARLTRLLGEKESFFPVECDITDKISVDAIFDFAQPDEVYNFAAQSNIYSSYNSPTATIHVNVIGAVNIMQECIKHNCILYNACSTEIFGHENENGIQREETKTDPRSFYASSKLMMYNIARDLRSKHGLNVVNGITSNHESERRSYSFVTKKIVVDAVRIKEGLAPPEIVLRNTLARKDFGSAREYVSIIHKLMMLNTHGGDFIISTGRLTSVQEIARHVLSRMGLNYEEIVVCELPEPTPLIYQSNEKISKLGINPQVSIFTVLDQMIEHEIIAMERLGISK
jgi:GDPmannose 4,6-dehydratase